MRKRQKNKKQPKKYFENRKEKNETSFDQK
jgi:hypothetical protein